MSVPVKKRVHKRVCCVSGCPNDTFNASYYSFPNREWERKRKEIWIANVRRAPNGKDPWVPSKHTTICSAHFVGGEKSNDPRKENYNPTIFPWKPDTKVAAARRERVAIRDMKKDGNMETYHAVNNDIAAGLEDSPPQLEKLTTYKRLSTEVLLPKLEKQTREISVQTDAILFEEDHDATILYCSQDITRNEVSTQTNIPVIHNSSKVKIKVVEVQVQNKKPCRTVAVGPDLNMRMGFLGFDDVKNDEKAMKRFGGISLAIFYILLEFVKPGAAGRPKFYRVLNSENRLLLFLMKMKLGLPFVTLSCFFKIGKQTASDIFHDTLETLYTATKTWIFWPTREDVKELLPSSFKPYPNCRAIIDCIELQCETPSTVDQRVEMYSSNKSSFTVKYLIAITPNGFISFISKGYSGRTSDYSVVNGSGFFDLVEPGDEIMADKGCPQIRSELVKRRSALVMPPFTFDAQFSGEQVLERKSIGSVRTQAERAIQRIRIFKVLDYIPTKSMPWVDKIVYMSCVLANNKGPIIK